MTDETKGFLVEICDGDVYVPSNWLFYGIFPTRDEADERGREALDAMAETAEKLLVSRTRPATSKLKVGSWSELAEDVG